MLELLKGYFANTSQEQIKKDWTEAKIKSPKGGTKLIEFMEFMETFNAKETAINIVKEYESINWADIITTTEGTFENTENELPYSVCIRLALKRVNYILREQSYLSPNRFKFWQEVEFELQKL